MSLTDIDQQIIALYESGWKQKAIAEELGCSVPKIKSLVRRVGIAKTRDLSKLDQQIIELYSDGQTQIEVAKTVGCSKPYVAKVLKNASIFREKPTSKTRLLEQLQENSLTGCWEFLGMLDEKGYGRMSVNGQLTRTHRLAYILFVGEISSGLHVLHRCDNRKCCNYQHLYLGTNNENIADRNNRNRQSQGEKHPKAKFTASDIKTIFELRSEGLSHRAIGKIMGCSHRNIGNILNGKIWKSATPG